MAKNMYQKREDRKNKPEVVDNKTNINWYPGHMAKTKRLIKEKEDLIDVIYEVIDARIPSSSKIADIDNLIKKKPTLLIFNKSDLCDLNETKKWQKHYENKGYQVVLTNSSDQNSLKEIMTKTNLLMTDINNKRLAKGMMKKRARVLIVGIPNVGKSTLINRLVGKKATNVGNKPGVTKSLGWIRINENLELLDTPGLLWPKIKDEETGLNLSTFTAIREEILPLGEVSLNILTKLEKYYPHILESRYGLKEISEESFDFIGQKRGALIKGGIVDYDKVYSLIVNDIKDGNIKGITFDRYEK